MGGYLQARLWPRNDEERAAAEAAGYNISAILYQDDLCKGEQVRAPARMCPSHVPCRQRRVGVSPSYRGPCLHVLLRSSVSTYGRPLAPGAGCSFLD